MDTINLLIVDVFIVLFLLFMALTGVRRGHRFAAWHLFFSVVVLAILLIFFLNTVTNIVSEMFGDRLIFAEVNLSANVAILFIVTSVLLFGWIVSGLLYLIFIPIKAKNYAYRDFDPMVKLKDNALGFFLGLIEGVLYLILFNVVLDNLMHYLPELFPNNFSSLIANTLDPDKSYILNFINDILGDYQSLFLVG